MKQKFVDDESKTIEDMVSDATVAIGEKITVRRVGFAVDFHQRAGAAAGRHVRHNSAFRRDTASLLGWRMNLMANITAALVKELRERTNAGMMDCKKALVESDGDMDKFLKLSVLATKSVSQLTSTSAPVQPQGVMYATTAPRTNAGMMDCKKALVESDGDMDKAIDWLREKGLAQAAKKAGRIAAEGASQQRSRNS